MQIATMKWYYSKKGNVSKRGQADLDTLREMARDGRLSQNDLVCSESDPRWILASEVDGLFPKAKPRQTGKQQGTPVKEWQGQTSLPARRRRLNASRLRELVFALFCVVIFAIWELKPHPAASPLAPDMPPPPQPVANSNAETRTTSTAAESAAPAGATAKSAVEENAGQTDEEKAWFALCNRFEAYMNKGDASAAARILERMMTDFGSNDVTAGYRDRLSTLKNSIKELDALKVHLMAGTLGNEQAVRLAELSVQYDRPGHLRDVMLDTLADPVNPSAAKCAAVLRTALLVLDQDTARKATAEYAARMDPATDETTCVEVASLCARLNMRDSAEFLLEKLLETNTKSGSAWLELGAIQAEVGRADDSIKALKQAVKFGGKPAKRLALADKRFDSIRDTPAFRRCTR